MTKTQKIIIKCLLVLIMLSCIILGITKIPIIENKSVDNNINLSDYGFSTKDFTFQETEYSEN